MRHRLDAEAKKLAPDIHEYWFFWRPVLQDVCSFKDMWVEQLFSIEEINFMHQMLDFKTYSDASQPTGEEK